MTSYTLRPDTVTHTELQFYTVRYSDDQGKTWSPNHYTIPVPRNYIETVNSFSEAHGGKGNETATQIMWQVRGV